MDSDRAKIQRRKEMGYPLPGQSGSATKIPWPVPTHLLTLQEMYARAQDDTWGYRTKYLPRLNQGQTATGDALDSGTVRIPTPDRESFEAETRWWTDAYVEHILQPNYHRNAQAHRRPYKHILDHGGDTLGGIEREVRWLLGPLPRPVGARLSPGVQFAKTVVAGMLTLLGLDFLVDGFEASSGEDFITGAPLTPGQQAFSQLATGVPFVAALWLRRAENAAVLGLPAPAATTRSIRATPGTAWGGENLPDITGQWLRGSEGQVGLIPRQVADALRGRRFANFDSFQREFWLEVSRHPELMRQFSTVNQGHIRAGNAPFARASQQTGASQAGMRYNLHHRVPLEDGGLVYDLDNLLVVSPYYHYGVLHGQQVTVPATGPVILLRGD